MIKILNSILLICILSLSALADSENVFYKANELYNNGEYESAISAYDSLSNSNLESANIYYNTGNSYYKLGDIPNAILYFEKAKKIEPNNSDILYNIELANIKIADKIEIIPQFFLKTWYLSIRNYFNEKQWTTINISLFVTFLLLIVIFYVTSKKRQIWFSLSVTFFTLTVISGFIGYNSYKERIISNAAIIFTPTVDIKSAPDTKSSTIFILHQGTKISLLEHSAKWQKIRIASGSEGWLKIDDFKEI